jgi:hypothetical protein
MKFFFFSILVLFLDFTHCGEVRLSYLRAGLNGYIKNIKIYLYPGLATCIKSLVSDPNISIRRNDLNLFRSQMRAIFDSKNREVLKNFSEFFFDLLEYLNLTIFFQSGYKADGDGPVDDQLRSFSPSQELENIISSSKIVQGILLVINFTILNNELVSPSIIKQISFEKVTSAEMNKFHALAFIEDDILKPLRILNKEDKAAVKKFLLSLREHAEKSISWISEGINASPDSFIGGYNRSRISKINRLIEDYNL